MEERIDPEDFVRPDWWAICSDNTRIFTSLNRAGIKTLEQLLQCSRYDLAYLPDMWRSTVYEIEKNLEALGLYLREPPLNNLRMKAHQLRLFEKEK